MGVTAILRRFCTAKIAISPRLLIFGGGAPTHPILGDFGQFSTGGRAAIVRSGAATTPRLRVAAAHERHPLPAAG
eukprot:COSAG01_NODE_36001_length_523_cov_21.356132_2_plen_74_part_01